MIERTIAINTNAISKDPKIESKVLKMGSE